MSSNTGIILVDKKEKESKFNFAITGTAEGDESEIAQLLNFALTELNLRCEFIDLRWKVLISKSQEDELS